MNNPAYMIDCPTCKGTGLLTDDPCPYAPDEEVDCANCSQTNCGNSETCDTCDGAGSINESDLDNLLKWRDYEG